MKLCAVSVSVLVTLSLCSLSAAFPRATIDDRMDNVVEQFANFKDIVNLNLFLYELLTMISDVTPRYGTVQYFHNQHPEFIRPTVVETTEPEEESTDVPEEEVTTPMAG
uniref:Uncharacterized protein n=1 Tax=Anopheles culicifacies TaxID=139723 RepID=A0A182MKD0_9DIPT